MFFAYKKLLDRTERRTRDRMYCTTIRSVRDISRDDQAIIASSSLRTPIDRHKEMYSIDNYYKYMYMYMFVGTQHVKMQDVYSL